MEENRGLKAKILDLSIMLEEESKLETNDGEASKDMITEIKRLGSFFGLYFNMFAKSGTFGSKPVVDFTSSDPKRYKAGNEAAGVVLELYEFIPEKYHDLMELASKKGGGKLNFPHIVRVLLLHLTIISAHVVLCLSLQKLSKGAARAPSQPFAANVRLYSLRALPPSRPNSSAATSPRS